ncbi:hypothetical protein [Shewanella sp. Choline-02u-19]|uniref:hypothetical protein n=1 Tax=Shewanella sp. Choline-02u-19 TaxID=2058309 RepID=UPI0012FF0600|nr:hypothetical protein [Shewanella sp. Choline-02u-19]
MRIRKPRRTEVEKRLIYKIYLNGDTSVFEMSKRFMISTATIYKIVREKENE